MFKGSRTVLKFVSGGVCRGAAVRQFLRTRLAGNALKEIFDSDKYWQASNQDRSIMSSFVGARTGLFKNPYLTSADGLQSFTDSMLENAQRIVEELVNDTSDEGLKNYIKNLDTLSDVLCKVIDLCEFIRISHPSPKFLEVAQQCHEKMFNYMNLLNTNVKLCEILEDLLKNKKHITEQLSEEEITVGNLLLADFKKSGIDKDQLTRALFIELSLRISVMGQHFNNNAYDLKHETIAVSKLVLQLSVSPEIYKQIVHEVGKMATIGSTVKFNVNSHVTFAILKSCRNEGLRKQMWIALNQSSDRQKVLLELLLNYRKILALKMNCGSFNEYQLEDKMAKNPENVLTFLKQLETKIKPYCVVELRKLADWKFKDYDNCKADVEVCDAIADFDTKIQLRQFSDQEIIQFIRPWDREYLVNQLLVNKRRKEVLPLDQAGTQLAGQSISSFFSLGTVLSNLSKLLTSIYGVKFQIDKPLKGEIWHKDVRKLLVVNSDDSSDIVGIIYLDLFERPGKSPNPAHFTIVCSRKITDPEELANCEVLNRPGQEQKYIQCVENAQHEIYQLPIITLVCNFSKSRNNLAFLSLVEVETLFHEIGHSLHSMFARTNLHNVSGTRCLTDFVELPSILMETFSKDPRVLNFLSEHYNGSSQAGEAEFKARLINLHQSENEVLKYCDVYSQLKMAYLDQQFYLNTPNPVLNLDGRKVTVTPENLDLISLGNLDELVSSNLGYADQLYHTAEAQMEIFADLESSWYGKFGHLFTYGVTYYTYLFDRAISSRIYKDLFSKDPFNRTNGLIFKDSVLKWGGSRSPWLCIGDCLHDPRLAKGDQKSMKLIGEADIK